ncbi:MAG TPA: hypothetical protein QF694_00430, partial [Dehalococcoidia bacterium]|nr:hypothetical protein [Dehalococcoidia bacterium]
HDYGFFEHADGVRVDRIISCLRRTVCGGKREICFMFSSAGIGAFSGIMVAGRLSPGRRLGWVIPGGSGIVFCDHAGGVELAFTGTRNGAGCAGLLLERIFQHFVDKRRTATCSRGHSGPGDGRIRNLTELPVCWVGCGRALWRV